MTDLIEHVKRQIPPPCCVRRCRKEKCTVVLKQAPSPFVLVDLDCDRLHIEEGSRRCDFLFVSQEDKGMPGLVGVLELKGRPRASVVAAQLQAGAQFAERVLPGDVELRFRPVLFYSGGLRGAERDRIRNTFIRFRHPKKGSVLKTRVILKSCGSPLKDALR